MSKTMEYIIVKRTSTASLAVKKKLQTDSKKPHNLQQKFMNSQKMRILLLIQWLLKPVKRAPD